MGSTSDVIAQKLTRLGQLIFLVEASRGVTVPWRAVRGHTLPASADFVRAGGQLRSATTAYGGFRGPGDLDYRGLPFIRSLVDSRFQIVFENGEFVVDVANGLRAYVPAALAYAGLGMIDERFVRREFEGWDVRDAVVIDVGANIGDSALYFIARGAHYVLAYEPFSSTAHIAARNFAMNHLEDRVELHRLGISRGDQTRVVAYDPLQPHLASSSASTGADTVEVRLTTLSTALSRAEAIAGAVHPIILKVDCEGCEAEIFSEELHNIESVRSVLVETHSAALKRQVGDCLGAAGFRCSVMSQDPRLNTAVLVGVRSSTQPAVSSETEKAGHERFLRLIEPAGP